MFIFDAGTMKKTVRGMRILRCSSCGKETPHDLTEIGFYVTALEVPLAPYKKKFVLMCRQCGMGEEIDKGEFKRLLEHSEETGYRSISEVSRLRSMKTGRKFCRQCGAELRPKAKFCNDCGKPIL